MRIDVLAANTFSFFSKTIFRFSSDRFIASYFSFPCKIADGNQRLLPNLRMSFFLSMGHISKREKNRRRQGFMLTHDDVCYEFC